MECPSCQESNPEAAAARGDSEKSRRFVDQARETVNYIAEHSGSAPARENFLNLDAVKRLAAGP